MSRGSPAQTRGRPMPINGQTPHLRLRRRPCARPARLPIRRNACRGGVLPASKDLQRRCRCRHKPPASPRRRGVGRPGRPRENGVSRWFCAPRRSAKDCWPACPKGAKVLNDVPSTRLSCRFGDARTTRRCGWPAVTAERNLLVQPDHLAGQRAMRVSVSNWRRPRVMWTVAF